MGLRPQQVIDLLGLKPHPTCGFVAETFRSQQLIPQAALPAMYEGGRPFGSVLYFMVTPEARIRLHRIRSDQMYHHYLGDPLEVLLLHPDGSGAVQMVGSDLATGARPQLFIPAAPSTSRGCVREAVIRFSGRQSGLESNRRTSSWEIGII